MEYRNNEQEQEYSLYTEKIVPSPKVKYRRVIRAVKLLVLIVFIGVVYVVSDKIVIPAVRYKIAVKNATVDRIEFTRDEYPDTIQQDNEEGIGQIKYDYDTIMQALRSKVIDVQRTVVTVREHIEENVIDETVTGEDGASKGSSDSIQRDLKKMQDEDEELFSTVGIIVGYLNDRYMILTSQLYTDVTSEYDVIVQDAGEYKAELVCSDELTGISIISIDGSKVSDNDRQYMQVAELGNSYMLNKGDIVIASGKIYGTDGAVDYGTITNRTSYNSIDNNYEVFETNLSFEEGDYVFLFNSEGEVVAISQDSSDTKLRVLGVSDLKSMIQCMINRQGKMYFGIKAQNVDSDLSEKNDIPMGIYISMVESDSPAYQAGLQPGDIIQGINKMPCYTMQRLNDKLCDSAHGQVINVSIKRKGKSGYFDVSYDVSVELR
jgi:serine protease Do